MSVRVGINGFGRVGHSVLRVVYERGAGIEVVAVSDLVEPATLAHLLAYDCLTSDICPEEELAASDCDLVRHGEH
ncbi:MAG: glyceraldehyde 3-phosphate dehydrogenase NAD-binding domain-containing protein [Solirubrobacteraceae bacterium]